MIHRYRHRVRRHRRLLPHRTRTPRRSWTGLRLLSLLPILSNGNCGFYSEIAAAADVGAVATASVADLLLTSSIFSSQFLLQLLLGILRHLLLRLLLCLHLLLHHVIALPRLSQRSCWLPYDERVRD